MTQDPKTTSHWVFLWKSSEIQHESVETFCRDGRNTYPMKTTKTISVQGYTETGHPTILLRAGHVGIFCQTFVPKFMWLLAEKWAFVIVCIVYVYTHILGTSTTLWRGRGNSSEGCLYQPKDNSIKLAVCYFSSTWFVVFSGFQIPGSFKSLSFHNSIPPHPTPTPATKLLETRLRLAPCCVWWGGEI